MIRRLAAVLAGVVAFAAAPAVAQAHPLGNFTVNRYSLVQIDKGSVRVTFVLDEAEIPTFQELGGQPTAAAARAWAERPRADVREQAAPDRERRATCRSSPTPAHVTATLRVGQGGLHCLRVDRPAQRVASPARGPLHGDVLGRHVRKPGGVEGGRHARRARGRPHPVDRLDA